jgi:hypothetical protein
MATEQTVTVPKYTGDSDHWKELERAFNDALDSAPPDAKVVALALRAGLAEIAVDISGIRAFGAGSRRRDEAA